MAKGTILIIEDEARIVRTLRLYFEDAGYKVASANDGADALPALREHDPTLIILDVMLPSMDGWAVLRRIRAESAVPVIMLTALGEERDRLDGLTMGADDYVVKPFSPREVVARTEAVLRRAGGNPDMAQGDGPLIVGPLEIDSAAHAAALDGEPLDITASEFALLQMLARHTGQALSRESLLEALPQADWDSSERIVDQHVKNLRRKLGTHAHLIGTVRGIGYRFERE